MMAQIAGPLDWPCRPSHIDMTAAVQPSQSDRELQAFVRDWPGPRRANTIR
jgi:hypothetical protein